MANVIWSSGIANAPTVELVVSQQSQDIGGNYSILAYSLILHRPLNVSSSASKSYSVSVNGVGVASGTTTIGGSGDKTIASGTTVLYHNSDGTKTGVPFSFTMDIAITWSGQGTGNASGSGSMNLTTIPRASTISSITGGTLGSGVTVNISRASTSFTHTVVYRKTNGTDVNVGLNQTTSCVFTPPLSDASLLPKATSGTATIFVHTYDGTTMIGTSSKTFTVSVPSSVVPTISSVSRSEAVAGIATQFGTYVQNKSKLAVTVNASGAYSSTISSYKTTILGVNYTTQTFTSGLLTSSGTVNVVTTVTDSRGRTATVTNTVTVVAYFDPKITTFSGFRSLSTGVQDDDDGTYLRTTMNLSIAPLNVAGVNKNTKSYKVEYRIQGAGTWTLLTSSTSVYTYNSAFTSGSAILNVDNAYDLRLTVTDYFGSTVMSFQVASAFTMVDWHTGGRSMAIGKVSDGTKLFDVGGNMGVDGTLTLGGVAYLDGINLNTNVLTSKGSAPSDISTITDSGIWSISGAYTNFYTTGTVYGSLMTIRRSSGSTTYIQYLFFHSTSGVIKTCQKWNGTMGAWGSFSMDGHTHPNYLEVGQGVETAGSNANGYYVKFGAGMMVCYGSIPTTAISNLSEPVITFPATFLSTASISFNATGRPSSSWTGFGIVGHALASTSGGRITVATSVPQNLTDGKWTAIGRWK